jgi:hypothetical protein
MLCLTNEEIKFPPLISIQGQKYSICTFTFFTQLLKPNYSFQHKTTTDEDQKWFSCNTHINTRVLYQGTRWDRARKSAENMRGKYVIRDLWISRMLGLSGT